MYKILLLVSRGFLLAVPQLLPKVHNLKLLLRSMESRTLYKLCNYRRATKALPTQAKAKIKEAGMTRLPAPSLTKPNKTMVTLCQFTQWEWNFPGRSVGSMLLPAQICWFERNQHLFLNSGIKVKRLWFAFMMLILM